jgi:DNA sulfur modification protein DndE
VIPHRIRVSDRSRARLKFLKSKTGLTPNILSRFAFVLSVRDLRRVSQSAADLDGQEFNAPTLFGEHQRLYELLLSKYVQETGDDRDVNLVIASHIENGLHKMGHIRSLRDVVALS